LLEIHSTLEISVHEDHIHLWWANLLKDKVNFPDLPANIKHKQSLNSAV